MKWQWAAGFGGGSIFLIITLLLNLSGVSNVSYTPDAFCGETCEAYINFTTTYWEFCFEHGEDKDLVYKKMTRSRRLWINMDKIDELVETDPSVTVEVLVPARGKNNWRPLKEDDCWKRTTKSQPLPVRLKLVAEKEAWQSVKWSFELEHWLSEDVVIDPVWMGYNYVYENKTRQEPIYKVETIKRLYNDTNKKWQEARNVTTKKISGYKTEYYEGDKVGVKVGKEEWSGNLNVDGNILSIWTIPTGDRNLEEYGQCRDYEVAKGVCKRVDLTQAVMGK